MITATEREALTVLTEVCEMSPDIRLGQMLAHLDYLCVDQTGRSLWDVDDDQLLAVLTNQRAELSKRTHIGSPDYTTSFPATGNGLMAG